MSIAEKKNEVDLLALETGLSGESCTEIVVVKEKGGWMARTWTADGKSFMGAGTDLARLLQSLHRSVSDGKSVSTAWYNEAKAALEEQDPDKPFGDDSDADEQELMLVKP